MTQKLKNIIKLLLSFDELSEKEADAIANYYGLKLVTRNTKDFNPNALEFVAIPYSI